MSVVTRELLRAMPKAELHCHLDGSIRPATLLELGREYDQPMPASTPESLAATMAARDVRDLADYLRRFETTLSVMQTGDAIRRIAYELVEDAAGDGVRYMEIRFCPALNVRGSLSLSDVLDASLRGIALAERDHDTRARVIVCALRNMSPAMSLELAELAVAYKGRGVVGFDLAGGEHGNPALTHVAAFDLARRAGLGVTVHAGEAFGPKSIRQAVFDLCADRIGHGTRLFEDPDLASYVNDRRITLEICLTSNVQTRVVPAYDAHPLRTYFDHGMSVTLSTDNRLVSGTTLTDEYLHAARALDFTLHELGEIALESFASAFLPWETRRTLLDEARREIEALTTAR
ncbi:MAG TPA: adenosine deaminase [Gemmatimonadaceae bacterium]